MIDDRCSSQVVRNQNVFLSGYPPRDIPASVTVVKTVLYSRGVQYYHTVDYYVVDLATVQYTVQGYQLPVYGAISIKIN